MSPATSPNTTEQEQLLDEADLTVADAVWIATAVLQRDAGDDRSFPTDTIVQKVESLYLTKGAHKSIWLHVNQHCVANRKAQPNRACILWATGKGNRRLFREATDKTKINPERIGGRMHPEWAKLPAEYGHLQQWYETIWNATRAEEDPLLAAIGIGREIWADQHADEYVAELRDWRME